MRMSSCGIGSQSGLIRYLGMCIRRYAPQYAESAERSAPMKDMAEGMLSVLDRIKLGEVRVDSVEDAVRLMAEEINVDQ